MSQTDHHEPQGATSGPGVDSRPPLLGSAPEGLTEAQYLHQLACKLTEWQQVIFNSADGGNTMGLRKLANEIQVAAYELRILMGMGTIEAKLGASLPLLPEEQAVVMNRAKLVEDEERTRQEDERRAESIRKHQEGLHNVPVPKVSLQQGRLADQA